MLTVELTWQTAISVALITGGAVLLAAIVKGVFDLILQRVARKEPRLSAPTASTHFEQVEGGVRQAQMTAQTMTVQLGMSEQEIDKRIEAKIKYLMSAAAPVDTKENETGVKGWQSLFGNPLAVQGESLLRAGRLGSAAEKFMEWAAQLPDHPAPRYMVGLVNLRMKEYTTAAQWLRQAIERAPNVSESHNNLAGTLMGLNLDAEALVHAEKAVTLDPDNLPARFNLGQIYRKLGRVKDALAQFYYLLGKDPNDALVHSFVGILNALDDQVAAIGHLENAVSLAPWRADFRFQLGFVMLLTGDLQYAKQALKESLRLDSRNLSSHEVLGEIYLALGDYGLALMHIDEAIALDDSEGNPYFLRAVLVYKRDWDIEQALRMIGKAITRSPGQAAYYMFKAEWLAVSRRDEDALNSIRQAAKIDPADDNIRIALGEALARVGRLTEARAVFAEIAPRGSDSARFHVGLAAVRRAEGDFLAAEKELRFAMTLPNAEPRIMAFLCQTLTDAKKYADAQEIARKALESGDWQAQDYVDFGNAFVADAKPREALAIYNAGKEKDAPVALLYNNAAFALHEMGRNEEVEPELRHALRIDPTCREALHSMMDLAYEQRDVEKFLTYVKRLLVAQPVFKEYLIANPDTYAEFRSDPRVAPLLA